MATITAEEFKLLINAPTLADETAEIIIDQGINKLSSYGPELNNMTGNAGSKTWSGTSKQKGSILEAALIVYYSYYKGVETASISALSVSMPNIVGNPAVDAKIEKLAHELMEIEASTG